MQSQEVDEFDEIYRRVDVLESRVGELERMLLARGFHGHWKEPNWINNYDQVDPPLEPFKFRVYTSGFPEFKGHINVQNASSGDPAFILPLDEDIEGPAVNLPYDMFDHIVITDDGGTTFIHALVFIDSTTNEFSLTWPAS